MKYLIILFMISSFGFTQDLLKEKMNSAFMNAQKGIYWGLSNLTVKKGNIKNDLIDSDKLIAEVSVRKEINGVEIESTGYFESYKNTIIIYKSYEDLVKEGYINSNESDEE